jgi:hypothetical protein
MSTGGIGPLLLVFQMADLFILYLQDVRFPWLDARFSTDKLAMGLSAILRQLCNYPKVGGSGTTFDLVSPSGYPMSPCG